LSKGENRNRPLAPSWHLLLLDLDDMDMDISEAEVIASSSSSSLPRYHWKRCLFISQRPLPCSSSLSMQPPSLFTPKPSQLECVVIMTII